MTNNVQLSITVGYSDADGEGNFLRLFPDEFMHSILATLIQIQHQDPDYEIQENWKKRSKSKI